MNRKATMDFLKDQLPLTVFYFINSLCLHIFYYITGNNPEVLYPIIISVFIWIVLMILQWFRYYPFYNSITNKCNDIYYKTKVITKEQEAVSNSLKSIQEDYEKRISELEIEYQTKNSFIIQWIHNIKTPVTVIGLILGKYSRDQLSENEDLRSIDEENNKINHDLQNLLQMMRFEGFSKDYSHERSDLLNAIKEVILEKRNQFLYNNILPQIDCDTEKSEILTDRKWNKYIIEQIVSNAIKYSAIEGKRKKIFFRVKKEKNKILLTIEDYGIGIPQYDMNRIFEPFFTGENGRNQKNSTGMGLYLCFLIASKLGHAIKVQSQEGKGTKVTIEYSM